MYLVAGLGNPGREYENTRHNVGYLAADAFARENNIDITKTMFKGAFGMGTVEGKKVIVLKPLTYMNLSGECIRAFADYYKIEPQEIIVIHDDVDFAFGAIKIRQRGSGGTHNGMKNIVACLGSTDFPRIRIGVGNNKLWDLKDFVLSAFSAEELVEIRKVAETASRAATMILTDSVEHAMNLFNTKKESKAAADPADTLQKNNGDKG